MTQKETLKLLKFNPKHENRKLAELNIILLILESEELKAWQAYQSLTKIYKSMAKENQD